MKMRNLPGFCNKYQNNIKSKYLFNFTSGRQYDAAKRAILGSLTFLKLDLLTNFSAQRYFRGLP